MRRRSLPPPPPPTAALLVDEGVLWRIERFSGLGFDDLTAAALAWADADWHLAAWLVENDCPLNLVEAIVA